MRHHALSAHKKARAHNHPEGACTAGSKRTCKTNSMHMHMQLSSPADPQTHPGAPPRFATQGRHKKPTNCTHPKRALPGHYPQKTPQHGHNSVAKRNASDPRTACQHGRFRERSGRRHAVLRKCTEAKQTASKKRRSTRTPNPHPRPPNRLHTPPLRKRNGAWHAVLRECAGVPGRRKAKLTTT